VLWLRYPEGAQQQMKLAGLLQGSGGVSVFVGCGDSEEDIVRRIKADAPVLRPDEPCLPRLDD
jgi:hypothetical protein